MKKLLSVLALAVSASVAMAAFTPITNITSVFVGGVDPVRDEINLLTLTTMGNTFSAATTALGNGTTTETDGSDAGSLPRMDNLNLNDLATGMSSPWRTVTFGGVPFTNQNGALPDFFLFEAAGGANPEDGGAVAAVFEGATTSTNDDYIGVSVLIGNNTANNSLATGWGDTGSNITANSYAQGGQDIIGIAWDITDLKDTNGVNLATDAVIKGITMTAAFGNLDPCALIAVVPPSGIDHFMVTTTAGSPQLVGVPFDVTITAQDPSNVTVSNSFSTINVAAAGTLMEFDWNNDGTYGDKSGTLTNGVATIKARNRRAETTASGIVATVGIATTVSPPSVTTIADVFSNLQVLVPGETGAPGTGTGKTGNPTIQGLGSPFNVTVNAVDLYWNFLAAAPADTISISATNELGVIAALPVVNAPLSGGTVVFSVTFTNSGPTNYIVAADVTTSTITNGVSGIVNASQSLVWQGDGVANNWDILTTANWTNLLGTVIQYNNGNFVAFDDTGSVTPAVNVVGTVTPLSVNLNSANNYSFITTNGGGIGGTGPLNKVGAGNLRIATSNSYSGGTRFTDGILTVAAYTNAVPNSGAFILTNATLVLETNLVHNNGSTRIVGSPSLIGGSFKIRAVGGGIRAVTLNGVTWGGTGSSLFPGEIGAQLILGDAGDNTTLEFKSNITLSDSSLGGDREIVVADGSQAVDVLFSGRFDDASAAPANLIKLGAGTMELGFVNNNNYAGITKIEGRLIIAATNANTWGNSTRDVDLGNGNTLAATLQLGNATSLATGVNIGALTASGTGTRKVVGGNPTNNVIITFSSNATTTASSTLSQALGGAGANENNLGLTKNITNYTLTLDAANTYTGPTTITAGTLALGAGSINNTTNINVQSGATFDVSTPGSFTLGAGKVLRGGGAINGNVTANGIVTPGSSGIGTLTFSNNLTLGASASLVMEINPTPTNDTIIVLGTFTPGGALVITNIGGTLVLGNTFQLFSTAVSGFSSTVLPVTPDGLTWTNKLAVDGTIVVVAAPISSNAYLTSLVLSPAGTLSPTFGSNVFTYTATNAFGISPTVKVVNANLTATNKLIYNNVTNSLASGVASSPLALTLGVNNPVVVEVTAQDGITVLSYTVNLTMRPSLTSPQLTNSVSGTTLSLSWPASHLGYTLQQQTNSLSLGLSTNWVSVPGSASVTSTNVTIDATSPTVFYRLVYP